jgi:hypothetical protein
VTAPITNPPLAKTGRPRKEPPRGAVKRIEDLAADGFSVLGIAKRLNTSPDTFRRWLTEYPELQTAFDTGRDNERWALHNMLFRKAIDKGDVTAAAILLNARHGYREASQSEAGNRVQINFQLPGALSMSEFQAPKVLEHAAPDNRNERLSKQGVTRT